ncbi:hypothetical protein RhiJN_09408 [Ceratobasidium sp. AG-Ba]|nr:hypothetical protein RhiJN_09408 [Ceratobasidium sp. AG-Ba]QRW10210.1 hypothetical protein RhiLY_09209 [Ceratobasidium sp. AG-Ba]
MSVDDEDLSLGDVFQEPARPATPPPTVTIYHRKNTISQSSHPSWTSIELQLVGHHVLWAQHLWNASVVLADFLDSHSTDLCTDKSVLELGAGGALPSLVAALCGAQKVVITDYPDAPLVENITHNVDRNIDGDKRAAIKVEGYVWGTDPKRLLGPLSSDNRHAYAPDSEADRTDDGFDVIILSDLIFNHSQHAALLDTCEAALRPSTRSSPYTKKHTMADVNFRDQRDSGLEDSASLDEALTCPCVLVFFSHHRPQYAARDLEFFALAQSRGWMCEKVLETKMPAMFPNDPGDEEVRSTVHGWILRQPVQR